MRRHWGFRLPIIRGIVALGESLSIGFRALSISANFALGEVAEVRAKNAAKARKRVVKLLEAGEVVRVRVKQGGISASSKAWPRPRRHRDGRAGGRRGRGGRDDRARADPQRQRQRRAGGRRAPEEESDPAELGRWTLVASFVVAIGFVVGVFKVGPALLTELLPIKSGVWFVLTEGVIRLTLFLLYLTAISFLPSLRRVFQYHAAEHKAINAYEAGDVLEPEVVQRYSLIHPRCGTAFLLWVMVIAIFVFAFFGKLPLIWLIATRIFLLPVIAGHRVRADPLRGQAPGEAVADDAARAGAVAPAAHDAGAGSDADRGVDPRARDGAEARAGRARGCAPRRSHGLARLSAAPPGAWDSLERSIDDGG